MWIWVVYFFINSDIFFLILFRDSFFFIIDILIIYRKVSFYFYKDSFFLIFDRYFFIRGILV